MIELKFLIIYYDAWSGLSTMKQANRVISASVMPFQALFIVIVTYIAETLSS